MFLYGVIISEIKGIRMTLKQPTENRQKAALLEKFTFLQGIYSFAQSLEKISLIVVNQYVLALEPSVLK